LNIIKKDMEDNNRYALLNEGEEQKAATEAITEALEEMVEFINKRYQDPSVKVDRSQIGYCFYGNLHWGSIGEKRLTGDEVIDLHIANAIENIQIIAEDYPDAAIGDTMTDELIAYHVDELMKAEPVMHSVLLNRG
jgi:hypothetical protein